MTAFPFGRTQSVRLCCHGADARWPASVWCRRREWSGGMRSPQKKRAQATKRQANRGHTKPKLSTRLLSARVALSFDAACARWRCASGATPSESGNSSVPASPHCPVTRHHIHARHAQRQDRRRCNVMRRCRRSTRSGVISRTCN